MTRAWSTSRWEALGIRTQRHAFSAGSDEAAMAEISRAARDVLRAFSSSFFLVTRFLPAAKRSLVDVIYSAVRYPDEIVDSFPFSAEERRARLLGWEESYDEALAHSGVQSRLNAGVPWILAGFTEVIRRTGIPPEHYRSFLNAMRRDTDPAPFDCLASLITEYVYGSAIVVGYFLAHVYGTDAGASMAEAYRSAADLGVALQLTNFARDVAEDRERGRVYLPQDIVRERGVTGAVTFLAEYAESRYNMAAGSLDVFAPDTRPAIRSCIDVYRLLNRRILVTADKSTARQSVPIARKLGALPPSKYWRVPLAYMGAL